MGKITQKASKCPACAGTGRTWDRFSHASYRCSMCRGKGGVKPKVVNGRVVGVKPARLKRYGK